MVYGKTSLAPTRLGSKIVDINDSLAKVLDSQLKCGVGCCRKGHIGRVSWLDEQEGALNIAKNLLIG